MKIKQIIMYRLTHCWAFRIVLVHCKHHFTLEKEPKFIFIFYYFIHSQQACFVFLSSTWHVKVKSNEPCRRSCGTWPNKWDQTNVPKQGVILFSVNRLQLAKKSHVLLWKKLAPNSIFHTQWGGYIITSMFQLRGECGPQGLCFQISPIFGGQKKHAAKMSISWQRLP